MVPTAPRVIVFMGVSGSGKSSTGAATAAALQAPFIEGDDLHPESNRQKLRRGIPLEDADRWPWLDRLSVAVSEQLARHPVVVCTCSALKRAYRERLQSALPVPVLFVCLLSEAQILRARLQGRAGHFMPVSLLDSQLATLEVPDADENALVLRNDAAPEAIVGQVVDYLAAARALSATAARC